MNEKIYTVAEERQMMKKETVVDQYTTCNQCNYRIRPGWKTDKNGEICGRCAEDSWDDADHVAVNDIDYTTRDPWRGSEYD